MKKYTISLVCLGLLVSGCSSKLEKRPDPDADIKREIEKNKFGSYGSTQTKKVMPYQQDVSMMVGSRSNDSKVVVNAGKVLKVFIAPYKMNGTLIAGHDVYTYVEKPGFLVGESVPSRATDSVTTPLSKLPFRVNKRELNIKTNENEMSNRDVQNFNNNVQQKRYGYSGKNMERISEIETQRDAALLNYLKQKKESKNENNI